MTTPSSKDSSNAGKPDRASPAALGSQFGLFVSGVVDRRWHKELENGTTVIYYDVSGLVVMAYNPPDAPYAVGEVVRLEVQVRAYLSKNGPRYSLVVPGRQEGEF
jgi:hypothetical protein